MQQITDSQRNEAAAIVQEIERTEAYALARRWIDRTGITPLPRWRSCSIDHVRGAMLASTGVSVDLETMALALANRGFSAREINGEPSTNVRLGSLPKRGVRVCLAEAH